MKHTQDSTFSSATFAIKRRAYLGLFPVLTVIVLLTWLLDLLHPPTDPFNRVILPALAGVFAILTVLLLTWRTPVKTVERTAYSVTVAVYLAKYASSLTGGPSDFLQIVIWTPLAYALAFLAYAPATAIALSSLTLLLTLLIGASMHLLVVPITSGVQAHLAESYLASGLLILTLALISQVRRQVNRLQVELGAMKTIAHQDALTGTPNRRQVEALLRREFKRWERHAAPFSLILVDLDHFKRINDDHGHPVGDEVLRQAARILSELVRDEDHFGRWGGEEFLIIAPQTRLAGAMGLAERIRATLEREAFAHGQTVTGSFGVSTLQQGDTTEQLLKRADEALYLAKTLGRNRVEAVVLEQLEHIAIPALESPFPLPVPAVDDPAALDSSTFAWLAELGFTRLAPREELYRRVRAVQPGWLAAHIHARADAEGVRLATCWYMWMFLHDDRLDETVAGRDPVALELRKDLLLQVFRGHPAPEDDLFALALADLRGRLRSRASEGWIERFAGALDRHLSAGVWEARNRVRGVVPPLEEYRAMRPLAGGLQLDDLLVELLDGASVLPEVLADERVARLVQAAGEAVCWANDLYSLNKEVQHGDVHNLVLALRNAHGLSLEGAVREAVREYDAQVRLVQEEGRSLVDFGPKIDRDLLVFARLLEGRITCNARWATRVHRYMAQETRIASKA